MKTYVALAAVAAVATAAPGPTTKTQRCIVAGDPHYTPFAAKSNTKKDRFTVMGTGEFVLAAKGDFSVHGCQADQSWDVRTFKKTKGAITWNQDVVAQQGTEKVEVTKQGQVYINSAAPLTWDRSAGWKDARLSKVDGNVKVVQTKKNQLVAKFTDTGRLLRINYFNKDGDKFGPRSGLNLQIVTPKDAGYEGLCAEAKGKKPTHQVEAGNKLFTHGTCKDTPVAAGKTEVADEAIAEEIKKLPCQRLVRNAEIVCNGYLDCVYDTVVGCVSDEPLTPSKKKLAIDMAETYKPVLDATNKPYTCPKNAYVDTKSWPLIGFEDCACMWGFEKNADDETCVKKAAASGAPLRAQCFCDPNQPAHCSHDGDKSCGLPLKLGQAKVEECTDPVDAMNPAVCGCGEGATDCSTADYTLTQIRAPAFAQPKLPFGTQPVFELRNNGQPATNDDETWARVTIANVQPKKCGCGSSKPCKHNGVGDNTCFEKQELFGEQVCPAGTTECLPAQADAMLYRSDPNDLEVERKDKECQWGVTTVTDGKAVFKETTEKGFCSRETPCKHQGKGDGHCMPMTAFNPVEEKVETAKEAKCRGTDFWRLADPAPTRGWFFVTDATCDMTNAANGCNDDEHSYAMDKWCEHNCRPKVKGQEPFCPASHCQCDKPEDKKNVAPTDPNAWICPADLVGDGVSCRCTPGTERCGDILVKAKKGVFSFDHLTIGTPGTYQLKVQLVGPDQNTGSNTIDVSAVSSTFEVSAEKSVGECRAQDQWRVPDLDKSKKPGAGQAWFFEDDVARCTNLNADGTCQAVKKVYAMDTWCKANRCLPHTLGSHCTISAPSLRSATDQCTTGKYDAFGECCQSGRVDQCNVCDGDGSTCTIESYLSTFVEDSATSADVFDANTQGKSCPSHSPCAHLNTGDHSCVPKTFASSDKVGDKFQYCYKNADGPNDHWKKGTWDDANGQASIASGTFEDGNTDCFCPTGTADLSEKAAVEDQAETEFVTKFKGKIAELEQLIDAKAVDASMTKELEQKKIMLKNTEGGVKLHSATCEDVKAGKTGKIMTITNPKAQPMCGMFWANDGIAEALRRKDFCFKPSDASCVNDSVRCIEVPALTHVKTYLHCHADATGQKQFPTLYNTNAAEPMFFKPAQDDISRISVHGNVLTVTAQVQGTVSDAMDNTCMASADALTCSGDSECNVHLEAATKCGKEGGKMLACLAMNGLKASGKLGAAWKGLLTCYAKESTKTLKDMFSTFSFPKSPWAKKRRLAAGVTAAVRVTTGGNNGLIGTPSSSLSAGAAASKSGTAGAGSAAGTASMGAGMTALIALVSVGAVVGAAVGLKKRNSQTGFAAGNAGAPSSVEVATRGGAKEDATDIL